MISIEILSERQNHRCAYCGIVMTLDTQTICYITATRDHYIPKIKGGSNNEHNLLAACLHCNSYRGSQDALSFYNKVQKIRYSAPQMLVKLNELAEVLEKKQKKHGVKQRGKYLRALRRKMRRVKYYAQ